MPYPAPFHPHSPNTIIPETESEFSNQDDRSNYHSAIFPTSESSLGLDEHGVGRQRLVDEMPRHRIGLTPERLDSVSRRLQCLENDQRVRQVNGESSGTQAMDVSLGNDPMSETGNRGEEGEDTPTLDVAVQMMKELRKCIKELRVMYQMMQENHEIQKKEEAIRLMAYNEVLRTLTTHDY